MSENEIKIPIKIDGGNSLIYLENLVKKFDFLLAKGVLTQQVTNYFTGLKNEVDETGKRLSHTSAEMEQLNVFIEALRGNVMMSKDAFNKMAVSLRSVLGHLKTDIEPISIKIGDLKKELVRLNAEKLNIKVSDTDKIEKINLQIQDVANQLKNVNNLGRSIGQGVPIENNLSQGIQQTAQSLTLYQTSTGQANNVTLGFIQAIQDAPYGIRGVANNIEFMAQSFSQLKIKAGGIKEAFSQIKASLTGLNLAFMGLSIGLALWQYFSNKSQKEADNIGDSIDGIKNKIQDLIDKYREFKGIGSESVEDLTASQELYKVSINNIIDGIKGFLEETVQIGEGTFDIYNMEAKEISQRIADEVYKTGQFTKNQEEELNDILEERKDLYGEISGLIVGLKSYSEIEKKKIGAEFFKKSFGEESVKFNEAKKKIEDYVKYYNQFKAEFEEKDGKFTLKDNAPTTMYDPLTKEMIATTEANLKDLGRRIREVVNKEIESLGQLSGENLQKIRAAGKIDTTPKEVKPKKGDTKEEIEKKRIEALIQAQELQVEIAEQSKVEADILREKNMLYIIYSSAVEKNLLTEEDFVKFEKDRVKLGGEINGLEDEQEVRLKAINLLNSDIIDDNDRIRDIESDTTLSVKEKLDLMSDLGLEKDNEKTALEEIQKMLKYQNLTEEDKLLLLKRERELQGQITEENKKTTEEIIKQRDAIQESVEDFVSGKKEGFDDNYENQKKSIRKEAKLLNKSIEDQLDNYKKLRDNGKELNAEQLEDEKKLKEDKKKIGDAVIAQEKAVEKLKNTEIVSAYGEMFGSLKGLFKEHTDGQKAMALAEVTIKQGVAIANIIKDYSNPIIAIPLIAAAVAQFASIFHQITSVGTSFARGGFTGEGGRFEEAGVVHKGEVVFEKPLVDKYKNPLLQLRSMMQNGGSYVPYNTNGYDMGTQRELKALRNDMNIFMKQDRNLNVNLRGTMKGQKFLKDEMPKHNKFTKNKYV